LSRGVEWDILKEPNGSLLRKTKELPKRFVKNICRKAPHPSCQFIVCNGSRMGDTGQWHGRPARSLSKAKTLNVKYSNQGDNTECCRKIIENFIPETMSERSSNYEWTATTCRGDSYVTMVNHV